MAELEALQEIVANITEAGGSIIAISPQAPKHSRMMEKKLGLEFQILHDFENKVAEAYGLKFELPEPLREIYGGFGVDLPKHHGSGGWELPMPSRYLVATDGTVADSVVHPDYTRRPEPQDTLKKLHHLNH